MIGVIEYILEVIFFGWLLSILIRADDSGYKCFFSHKFQVYEYHRSRQLKRQYGMVIYTGGVETHKCSRCGIEFTENWGDQK